MGVSYPQTDVSIQGSDVSLVAAGVSLHPPNDVTLVSLAGFDPAAVALFAYLNGQGVPPSKADQTNYNNFIVALKAAGVWSLLDVCYLFAAADQTAALVNIVNPGTHNASAISSPVFTAYRGFTGNGTSAYVDSNFNPATAGGNYSLNSAVLFARNLSAAVSAFFPLAGSFTSFNIQLQPNSGSNFLVCQLNDANAFEPTLASPWEGLMAANRSSSSAVQGYVNGSSIGSNSSDASASIPSGDISFLSTGGSFSSIQVASGGFGASLTAAQHAALYAAENAYMTAVGA